MENTRKISGKMIDGWRATLSAEGRLAAMRQRCSTQVLALLDGPPSPPGLQDDSVIDDLLETYLQHFGSPAAQQFSLRTVRESVSSKLFPLMSAIVRLFGATPASLYARLDSLKFVEGLRGPLLEGYQFSYEARDDHHGTIRLTLAGPLSLGSFIGWQGVFALAFEFVKRRGTVSVPSISADRCCGTYEVSWD